MTTTWRAQAACRIEDPLTFFPTASSGPALLQIVEAKSICHNLCPVRPDCLEWALSEGDIPGIYGGHTRGERRRLARAAAETTAGAA